MRQLGNAGIYVLTNQVNGRQYVGKDFKIGSRAKQHLKLKDFGCIAIHSAIKAHKPQNFSVELIRYPGISPVALASVEMWKIAQLGSYHKGYNCSKGGDGSTGRKLSEETKRKIGEVHRGKQAWNKGKQMSEEQRQNMRGAGNGMYGKTHTPEVKVKCREASLKRVWTPEQRQRQSEFVRGEAHPMYGKSHAPETRKKISDKLKGNGNPMYGKTHTLESKARISEKLRGKVSPFKGKSHSPKVAKAIIETRLGMSQEAFVVNIAWLLRNGWTQRDIAYSLEKSKNTVGKYAKHARHYNETGEITIP